MLKHIFDSAQTQAMLSEIVSCTFSSLVFQVFEVRIFCLPFDQGTLKKKRILMVLNIFHRLISQQCHVVIHNHFFPATVSQCTLSHRCYQFNTQHSQSLPTHLTMSCSHQFFRWPTMRTSFLFRQLLSQHYIIIPLFFHSFGCRSVFYFFSFESHIKKW